MKSCALISLKDYVGGGINKEEWAQHTTYAHIKFLKTT